MTFTNKQKVAIGTSVAVLGIGIGGIAALVSPSDSGTTPNATPSVTSVAPTTPDDTPSTTDTPSSTPTTTHKVVPKKTPVPSTPAPKPTPTTPAPVPPSDLVKLVDSIRTESPDPASIPTYDRSKFGDPAPTEATRTALVQQEKTPYDTWISLWDGKMYHDAGNGFMQADHTVALAEAWRSGAWAWPQAKRVQYANDLSSPYTLNLITSSLNQQKGDKDPFDWMPPLNQCEYIKEWATIKVHWGLTADGEEKMALHSRAVTCSE